MKIQIQCEMMEGEIDVSKGFEKFLKDLESGEIEIDNIAFKQKSDKKIKKALKKVYQAGVRDAVQAISEFTKFIRNE